MTLLEYLQFILFFGSVIFTVLLISVSHCAHRHEQSKIVTNIFGTYHIITACYNTKVFNHAIASDKTTQTREDIPGSKYFKKSRIPKY